MSPTFRTRKATPAAAESPERLFEDLPRERGRADALWAHQADVLRTYHSRHLETPDLAIELPTGAGKTLPGLLITEWRRRKFGERCLYACPTQQLARQVAKAAEGFGIEAVSLIGPHSGWSTSEKLQYETASALGITTYNNVFNVNPHLEPADCVLFDDSHAAEQFVAGTWSVDITRSGHSALYEEILHLLKPALSGVAFDRLLRREEPRSYGATFIGVKHVVAVATQISAFLRGLGRDQDLYWRAEALGERLDRCCIYVSSESILIRPFIPPTTSHRHFSQPKQRIYLSATLGEGGELERAFGRYPIVRLPVPEGWDDRGAGRRFFLFPELQSGGKADQLASDVIAQAGKALVLAPSRKKAEAAAALALDDIPVSGPNGSIDLMLSDFRDAKKGLLLLANRYDGLDLPDAECRVTVLADMPTGAHLQERFLSETLSTGLVLRERLRTRVVQGAGRCTRGLSDFSVVVVLGDAATRFFALPEVHDALRPELQAEVDFGLNNSASNAEEILDFVKSFLAQDKDWRQQAEPELLEMKKAARRVPAPENQELEDASQYEIKAITALWSGDWGLASQHAQSAASLIRSPELKGYRAFWTYLGAAWLGQEAEVSGDAALRKSAGELLRKAHAAARATPWLRAVEALPDGERVLEEIDEYAVGIATEGDFRTMSPSKWLTFHDQLERALSETSAGPYEAAVTSLGKMLGAESYKPAGEARTDSAWIFGPYMWIALEAKTEESPGNPISVATVRQANDHLKTLAYDRQESEPEGSAVLVVGPKQLVDRNASIIAEPFLYMVNPEFIVELARDAVSAWKEIRAKAVGMETADLKALVRKTFIDYSILPTDIRHRLLRIRLEG